MSRPIFDNQAFLDWLRNKAEQGGRYSYVSNNNCLVAQYLQDRGLSVSVGGWNTYGELDPQGRLIQGRHNMTYPIGWYVVARERPWTFAAALARAERQLEKAR